MLLCTMFTQGGADDMHILDLLPDDDAYEATEAFIREHARKRAPARETAST